MKLRIRGNSLCMRLTRTEIAELVATGTVGDRVRLGELPEHALVYRLELSDAVTKPTTTFQASQLCVRLPEAEGREWAQNERVGIYGEESWGLKLIIEKDFKCLDPRLGDDESDAFENPNGASHAVCASA